MKQVELIWERRLEGPLPSLRDDKLERIRDACEYFRKKFKYLVQTSTGPEGVASGIEPIAGALSDFLTYLLTLRRSGESVVDLLTLVDDALLLRFRDWAFTRTREQSNSKNELTAKRTTNGKLRHIYDWIYYCMEVGSLPPDTMGMKDCKVRSSIPKVKEGGSRHLRGWKDKYPLWFRGVGQGSRSGLPQFFATQDQVDAIIGIFLNQADIHALERNILLAVIGNDVGWRRRSALSLSPDDFSAERISASRDAGDELFAVSPRSQKGGKHHTYYIPWPIAERIHQYVVGYTDADGRELGRPALLKRLGLPKNYSKDHIFLATDTGHPLKAKTLTDIFSDAFRSIGAPKGAGYHGLRRGLADHEMRVQLEFRMKNRLSTAKEDVVSAVSEMFGWSSASTYQIYMRVMASLFNGSVEIAQKAEISMLRIQLLDAGLRVRLLEAENQRLRSGLKRQVSAARR